jgi:hypothetical protein
MGFRFCENRLMETKNFEALSKILGRKKISLLF